MEKAAAEIVRLNGAGWSIDSATPCAGAYITGGRYHHFQGGRLTVSPDLKDDDWFIILEADEPVAAPAPVAR
jgi:hypothetical protein